MNARPERTNGPSGRAEAKGLRLGAPAGEAALTGFPWALQRAPAREERVSAPPRQPGSVLGELGCRRQAVEKSRGAASRQERTLGVPSGPSPLT